MDCMYHCVPRSMTGTILYPLNELCSIDEIAYQREVKKYSFNKERNRPDRSRLMKRRIPKLGCLWNDVLHSSSVHPSVLMEMWREVGYRPKSSLTMFEIPIATLNPNRLVIYTYANVWMRHASWNYVRYDPKTYHKFTIPSARARRAMQSCVRKKDIWHFLHIPHVLYQGHIDTKDLNIAIAIAR